MNGSYDDIIYLPHPTSPRHPRMSRANRAAQFSPFAALAGHEAAIVETARQTDRRVELSEDRKAELDQTQRLLLAHIEEHPEVTVTWFRPDGKKEGGEYVTVTGYLKRIDTVERTLCMVDGTKIPLDDVVEIQTLSRS